jgi:hypothetical protein
LYCTVYLLLSNCFLLFTFIFFRSLSFRVLLKNADENVLVERKNRRVLYTTENSLPPTYSVAYLFYDYLTHSALQQFSWTGLLQLAGV